MRVDATTDNENAMRYCSIRTLIGHESSTGWARFIRGARHGEPDMTSVDASNRVRTWNLSSNVPVFSARVDDASRFITQLDFSPDSSTLKAAGQASLMTIQTHGAPRIDSLRLIPSALLLAIPGENLVLRTSDTHDTRTLTLESLADQSRVWTVDNGTIHEFVVSPDGALAAVFRDNYELSLIRVADGVEQGRTPADPSGYHRPVFSPNGTTLATLENSGVLRLWDATTGALKEQIVGDGNRSVGLCWSDDGSLLAYAHAREGVTVLDMRTRKPLTTIENIGGFIWSIAISPDKTRMAVGAQDRVTHVFELPSGDELLQLRDHTGTVMSLAWSPDGRYLATGGYDKRLIIYDSGVRR